MAICPVSMFGGTIGGTIAIIPYMVLMLGGTIAIVPYMALSTIITTSVGATVPGRLDFRNSKSTIITSHNFNS